MMYGVRKAFSVNVRIITGIKTLIAHTRLHFNSVIIRLNS